MDQNKKDRKFLHDLATPMTIVRTILKKTLSEIEGRSENISKEVQIARLQKAISALEKMEELHADQKAEITLREVA